MSTLTVTAPAKVNLYLAVGDAGPDGYHRVDTIMQAIALSDVLTVRAADELRVECRPDVGVPAEENIVHRAACAFAGELGRDPDVSIEVEKHIPAAAGLGGGSSDAAATLVALSRLWGVDPDDPVVRRVAASLGADVPFFLTGGTALFAGKGDELVRVVPTPVLDIAVVKVSASVSAAAAYRAIDESRSSGTARRIAPPGQDAMLQACERNDADAVARALFNDMTDSSVGLAAEIADALAWVRGSDGVLGAEMAGSGSAVFAICDSAETAKKVAGQARERGWWACSTRSVGHGVEVGFDDGRQ